MEHPLTRPDSSLGDGLVEKISDWEPAAHPVLDTTLDGRLREGNTYLEHSAPGVSQWTHGGDIVSGTIGAVDSSFTVGFMT